MVDQGFSIEIDLIIGFSAVLKPVLRNSKSHVDSAIRRIHILDGICEGGYGGEQGYEHQKSSDFHGSRANMKGVRVHLILGLSQGALPVLTGSKLPGDLIQNLLY